MALQLWCAKICVLLTDVRFLQVLSLVWLCSSGVPKSIMAYVRKVFACFALAWLSSPGVPKCVFCLPMQGFCWFLPSVGSSALVCQNMFFCLCTKGFSYVFHPLGFPALVCQYLRSDYLCKVFASFCHRLALQLWCAKTCDLLMHVRFF